MLHRFELPESFSREAERYMRAMGHQRATRRNQSALAIQSWWRSVLCRKEFLALLQDKYEKSVTGPTTKLQAKFRSVLIRRRVKLAYLARQIFTAESWRAMKICLAK